MRTVDPVRHKERRQDILRAALRCFIRDGLRSASVSGICAEAGISPGHLYHYFASKEAILAAITQTVLSAVAEQFGRTMESSDAIAALMTNAQRAKARDGDGGNPLVFDMLAEAGRSPALARVLQDHSRDMRRLLADVLRKGQEHGQIDRSLDAEMAASLLVGVVDGFKATAVRDPSLDRAGMAELLRVLIARFLAPPAPDAGEADAKLKLAPHRRVGSAEQDAAAEPSDTGPAAFPPTALLVPGPRRRTLWRRSGNPV